MSTRVPVQSRRASLAPQLAEDASVIIGAVRRIAIIFARGAARTWQRLRRLGRDRWSPRGGNRDGRSAKRQYLANKRGKLSARYFFLVFERILLPRRARRSAAAGSRARFLSRRHRRRTGRRRRHRRRDVAGSRGPGRPSGSGRRLGVGARFLCPRGPRGGLGAGRRHRCGGSRITVRGVAVTG